MAGCTADKVRNFLILLLGKMGGHDFLLCLQGGRVAGLQGGKGAGH